MNERIQELFKRAGGKTSVRNLASNPVQVVETRELWDNRIEKFAKLIVQECLNVVKLAHSEGNEDSYSYDDALDHAEYNIKQHFGVEE